MLPVVYVMIQFNIQDRICLLILLESHRFLGFVFILFYQVLTFTILFCQVLTFTILFYQVLVLTITYYTMSL